VKGNVRVWREEGGLAAQHIKCALLAVLVCATKKRLDVECSVTKENTIVVMGHSILFR
jgi:hypothetical protein